MGLTLAAMQLSPNAQRAAALVLAAHPTIVFTSGRRDVRQQAEAMATNVRRYGTDWLALTYKHTDMVHSLTDWTHQHPDATASIPMMTEGYYQTLVTLYAGQLDHFPHCRGDAFDVQIPRFADGRIDDAETARIEQTIKTLPIALGLQLILTHEGAHRVIHAQFNHAMEPERT